MGFSSSAYLVIGISMAKLFTEFNESSNIYDEFDKYGNKTGKQFEENKLIGILPNGRDVIIADEKNKFGWNINWYDSLGFDGGHYIGDIPNVEVKIHYGDHESKDLSQMIMGIQVCETDFSNGGENFVVKVDEDITNAAIDRCRKQLAELFGYTGELNLYLINYLSY
jgi:hypothetical protein